MKKQQNNLESNPPKEICFVWNYLEWGGVQIYFLGLMRSASEKFRVKVILPKESGRKILDYLDANNIEYDFYAGKIEFSSGGSLWAKLKRRFDYSIANWRLAKHLAKYDLKNSIVQIDVAPWSGFLLLLYLTLKTHVFVTFHTAVERQSFLKQTLLRMKFAILNGFTRFHIVASNLDVKKSLRSLVGAKKYGQIEVVYSSVNIKEIDAALKTEKSRQQLANRYAFPSEKIWICNVAQFIERKGCWVFLEAIEILREQRDDLFFFWLGTAPLTDEVIAKVKAYDLNKNFRFLAAGEIGDTRGELLTLWKSADLFVMPSLQEGLPVALVEAMALGKTCITSNVNAIPEAVKHFETGILVAAGDSNTLANAISNLADDRATRERIGRNARTYAIENFDEEITGKKMLTLYQNANIP